MRIATLLTTAAVAAAVLPLAACAPRTDARVVVRIADAARPTAYEVHLVQADGGFREQRSMRSGETRSFAVPSGWLTVRVPGLCVVPTPATGTTTIEVRPDDCRVG